MKKTITVILTLTLLFSIFALSAFADSEVVEGVGEENIFETTYKILLENSDKILSALAFLASLLLALFYKKGLLPILKGSISKLNSTVSSMKEDNEKILLVSHEDTLSAKKSFEEAENLFLALKNRLESLEETLKASAEEKEERKKFKTVLNAQIDMLYEVFMSSSLPAYLKESIGERISEMKREIKNISTPDASGEADKESQNA